MLIFQELARPISQAAFGRMVNRSEGRISQLVSDGTLAPDGTAGDWLRAFIDRLSMEAAGRATGGSLDLAQERAALARSLRLINEEKLAVQRGEYAPIGLLTQVLAAASQAVADRFDHLPGMLAKTCPDLSEAARDQVVKVIAQARNEWARSTAELVVAKVMTDEEDEAAQAGPAPDELGGDE